MIKMAQYEDIRRKYFRERKSIRQIARELHLSRRTVSKFVNDPKEEPSYRRKLEQPRKRVSPITGPIREIVRTWIEQDQQLPKKQRHTGKRIFERLVKEYNFQGSESNIRHVVAAIRKTLPEVFIPLAFGLGTNAQCDWGEADIMLAGTTTRVYIFVMRLSSSRASYVRAYRHERQEAFFDAHQRAFQFFGGVPYEVTYDNLKTAVKKIMVGRNRIEQEAFVAMRAHFVFNSNFCNTRAGWEKGQAEGLVGYARRNFMVPIPEVSTLEELNEQLEQACREYAEKTRVPHSNEFIAAVWEKEKEHLLPLPKVPFDACRVIEGQVDKQSLVHFETNAYSVPCQYVGQKVLVKAYADEIKVVTDQTIIAVHKRSFERYQQILELEHYIDILAQKPRAVRDAAVLQSDRVPPIYRDFHRQMSMRFGRDGDRGFIRILYLHREYGVTVVSNALEQAASQGMYRYEAVSELVRRLVNPEITPMPLPKEQLDPALRSYVVNKPKLSQFDQLLPKGGVFH